MAASSELIVCNHGCRAWISAQRATASSCTWHVDAAPWPTDSVQSTPDLSDLITEVIHIDGWQPGSSISFLVKRHAELESLMESMATPGTGIR